VWNFELGEREKEKGFGCSCVGAGRESEVCGVLYHMYITQQDEAFWALRAYRS